MTTRKRTHRAGCSAHLRGERIKDEVYRQMFFLEEGRAGAETALAAALLRAWLAAGSTPAASQEQAWLRKISSLCLEMIEGSMQAQGTQEGSSQ